MVAVICKCDVDHMGSRVSKLEGGLKRNSETIFLGFRG